MLVKQLKKCMRSELLLNHGSATWLTPCKRYEELILTKTQAQGAVAQFVGLFWEMVRGRPLIQVPGQTPKK